MLEYLRYPRSAKLCFLKAMKLLEDSAAVLGRRACVAPKALKMLESRRYPRHWKPSLVTWA